MSTLLQTDYSEFQYSTNSELSQMPVWFWVIYGLVVIFMIASLWKVYTKCGEPGWACLVPIFNLYVMCRMVKKPEYFKYIMGALGAYILGFILIASGMALGGIIVAIGGIALLVITIMLYHALSLAFGQSTGFTVGLILLGFIFIPMLAWGNYQYVLNNENSKSGDLLDA